MPEKASLTPAERTMRARQAAYISWANTENRGARTQPGRDAMWEKFYDQVDPERKLTSAERHKRAVSARKAFFAGLALRSAKARRLAKEARGRVEGGAA
jgi:hypothetical protein